ncbi:MAG TPA: pyruvate oxidoreductase subunit gamma [Firmicutes bacterium]|nr:pyruvate oxidoreductase subunit gamma [Bacillota bacterium]
MKHWKVVAAGEGGQGVQSLAESLALAAYHGGWKALYMPNFGIEQRGGVSLALVQLSTDEIGSPKFLTADLLIVLSRRSLQRCRQYMDLQTIVLYDSSFLKAPGVDDQVVGLQSYETPAPEAFPLDTGFKYESAPREPEYLERMVAIPAAELARKKLHPRAFNMIILGASAALMDAVSLSLLKQALEEKLSRYFKRDPRLREQNFKGLELGFELARQEKARRPLLQEVLHH